MEFKLDMESLILSSVHLEAVLMKSEESAFYDTRYPTYFGCVFNVSPRLLSRVCMYCKEYTYVTLTMGPN